MSTLEKKVSKEYEGVTIREFLKEDLGLSSRLIRRSAIEKRILVNKKEVRMRYIVHAGDLVQINLQSDESQNITPEKMDLDIVYEDEDILVINKKPYMVVHPTKSYQSGTLANGVLFYFKETNQNCIVRLVSRLDMNTSGLIIIAKNQFAHMALSKEMEENNLEKRYLAIVHGNLKEKEGTIDAPIYRPDGEEFGTMRIVDERGQRSITHYKVIESFKDTDLVECLLETGRTHQIRVHMKHLGHPIYGDTLYGFEGDEELIPRQALHAYGLDFKSPKTKETLSLRAKLPEDMESLLKKVGR
ncbi:MAG: RluA family pseudouridine synthase [Clostridium sp.]|uniref:Pseudouridine synthase n=1 Tax=Clostridium paraputrificum TaxID=29363 RepID=A0A6N3GML4_9CLOT|nr:RluA family pseudouridine synthase [Clostridium sp.]MBS5926946.1 RluA family pseudouridine synthase [Clostridium sp.]